MGILRLVCVNLTHICMKVGASVLCMMLDACVV